MMSKERVTKPRLKSVNELLSYLIIDVALKPSFFFARFVFS